MVQLRPDEAATYLASRSGVLGPGWKEVDTFDGIDLDEYEEEEEEYATLDLGMEMDPRYLQTEGSYQLIGMDTPLPHLKMGSTVLQGEITPLVGSEVILGLIRNQEHPLRPSHPPIYTTSHRISFTPITLFPQNTSGPIAGEGSPSGEVEALELDRPMFLTAPAKYGPNAPPVLPGRKRDRDRAARRAGRSTKAESGEAMDIDDDHAEDGSEAGGQEATPEPESGSPIPGPSGTLVSSPATPSRTPGQGQGQDWSAWNPRFSAVGGPIGRPRTRPSREIESLAALKDIQLDTLPSNIRVIHEIDHPPKDIDIVGSSSTSANIPAPTDGSEMDTDTITNALSAPLSDAMHVSAPTRPLEYTKTQLKKLLIQAGFGPEPSSIRKIRGKAKPKAKETEVGNEGQGGKETPTRGGPSHATPGKSSGKRKPKPRTGDMDAMFVTVGHSPGAGAAASPAEDESASAQDMAVGREAVANADEGAQMDQVE